MRVRAAGTEDIPRLMALERQADGAAHWGEQHYRALFADAPASAPAGNSSDSAQHLCLVVEVQSDSGRAEGAADCEPSTDDGRPAVAQLLVMGFVVAQCLGDEWEIENLVVDAGSRRRGLASRLLDQLLGYARDQTAKAVRLEVRESNRAARGLYAKWGFRETGRRKNYYRDPEEAALLLTFSGGVSLVNNG
jgi:ribosomal-protein-alanine acetyltransferase